MLEKLKEELEEICVGLYEYVAQRMPLQKFDHLEKSGKLYWYHIVGIMEINHVEPYVEITSGKYKGSIGVLEYDTIKLGTTYDERCKRLSAKSLKLLPEYQGPPRMQVRAREIRDIFDQTIEPGDKVIYAERGKLRIGVLVEYRFHDNIAVITTPEGKEEVNPRTSQIVNCQKINESYIGRTVLTAKLRGDYE